MGNRSYLYLVDPEAGQQCEIVEANNNVPTLWHLLLAKGEAAPPITDQRVFGDAGTAGIESAALAALSRLQALSDCLGEHPLVDRVPALPRYLRALYAYLLQQLAEFPDPARVRIAANLDEYSWLDGDDADTFIARQRAEFDATWERLATAIARRDYPTIEHALAIAERGFEDWDAWCWEFGIGGCTFYHDYFSTCDEAPREVEFVDYVPQPDPWEEAEANDLGLGRRRFVESGRHGVRDAAGRVLLAPEWQQICEADENAGEELWVQQGDRWGLACVPPAGEARLLLAPTLDEAWNFLADLAVVRAGQRFGMLRRDGSWFLPPTFDELWDFENGYACALQDGRFGYLGGDGEWAIPPRFDDAGAFFASGLARACLQGRWGLIGRDGEFVAPPSYLALEWDDYLRLWRSQGEAGHGLLTADGRVLVNAEWEEVKLFDRDRQLYQVRRADQLGLVDGDGRLRLPCAWDTIEQRRRQQDEPQLIVSRAQRCGLVDLDGRTLIPCEFAEVDDLSVEMSHPTSPELLRVRAQKRKPTVGVWDLARNGLRVDCRWQEVLPLKLDDGSLRFIAAQPASGKGDQKQDRLAILADDGTPLCEPIYTWFGEYTSYRGEINLQGARVKTRKTWSAGAPLAAGRGDDGQIVWLRADGSVASHVDQLTADWQAGDASAAHRLGLAYRDGDGIAADQEAARLWLARAAEAGVPAAMADLASLINSEGGDLMLARRLLEQALAQPQGWTTTWARNLLGCYYLDGIGGDERHADAYAHFRLASQQGNAWAEFNLGLCYEFGKGVAADREQALARYLAAERKQVESAAYRAGHLIEEKARAGDPAGIGKGLADAALHYRRELALADAGDPWTCLALARLLEAGEVAPAHPDEQRELLECGAKADHLDCIDGLLRLLENPGSRYYHPATARTWREIREETARRQ